MIRLLQLWLLALALGPLLSSAGGVHDPRASEILTGYLAPLRSLSADFVQTVTDNDGYELQSMTGSMTVARPGKVHWESNPPYEQLVISDADNLWLYDRDLEQVTVRPFDNNIANTPAVLFIGETAQLDKQYRVSSVSENGRRIFTLVPRDSSALYDKVTVTFDGSTPVGMTLSDSLGQTTRIEFSGVRVNDTVDPSLFTFAIPDGVDVLREN